MPRTDSYVLLDTSYMYNKYPYMSDLYIIPKTCTRTCLTCTRFLRHVRVRVLFLEISIPWSDLFLKIDVGPEWESHGAPSVRLSHGRRCAGRVCLGRDAGWNSIGLTGGLGFPRIGSRCWEVLSSKNSWAGESNQKTKLRKLT